MRDDLLRALDPVHFAESLGLVPDPWQAQILGRESNQVLLLCSRQAGKSTVTTLLALHTTLYRSRSLILLLSPSQRQSGELFRKVKAFYDQLPDATSPRSETALRLELQNGSRIVSLPGKEGTIRGYSGVDLLIIDEAARVEDGLYYSVRPMLAVSRGSLVALTTPFGRRGWFFNEWSAADPTWQRIEICPDQCPRNSQDFLELERASIGDWWFRQEYLCQFLDTVDQLFPMELVSQALSSDIKPLWGCQL